VLAAVALVGLFALPSVQALACPSLMVSARTRPASPRKAGHASIKVGQAFTVYAKVRNTGAAPMHNASLRMTVPFSADYRPSKPNDAARGRPVLLPPNAYWPSFSLRPGKSRVFKLSGKVAKCAQSDSFDVDVEAYILADGCTTPIAAPLEVLRHVVAS